MRVGAHHRPVRAHRRPRRRAGDPRRRSASDTGSIPSRCPTSSPCAATRPTGSPAPRASARDRRRAAARARLAQGVLEHARSASAARRCARRSSTPATSCSPYKDIATLRDARVRRPRSRRTDWKRAARRRASVGMNRLADRLQKSARARPAPMAGPARERGGGQSQQDRRALPLVLIVLATIIGIVSVFALWAKRQLLETETWGDTSEELIEERRDPGRARRLHRHHDLRQRRCRGRARQPPAAAAGAARGRRSRARFATPPTTSPCGRLSSPRSSSCSSAPARLRSRA